MKTKEELKKEQQEAKSKLHELVEFINSEEFYTLTKPEQGLVIQERTGLELYLTSLTKRVYGTPNEPDSSNMIWLTLLYGMFNTNSFNSPTTTGMDTKLKEADFKVEEGNTDEEHLYAVPV